MSSNQDSSPLNTLDRSVGRLLRDRSEGDSELLEILGALTSQALRQGHVCLELEHIPGSELALLTEPLEASKIQDQLRNHASVGSEREDNRLLILSKANKLYFHRFWHYERQLIRSIEARITDPRESNKASNVSATLGKDQQKAVALACHSSLTFISGGPGTGKTTTVLHILASLHRQGQALKIALAAPTGKAAQRIQESLTTGWEQLELTDAVKERISTEASTLHRLLGYKRNSTQFKHDENNPLPYDVVVVDEASMLDLLLFAKLLKALKPNTKLILLGDSHQLASVEAGSIFGDLIIASKTNPKLEIHTVQLRENFRFGNNSPLYQACEYIKEGESKQVLELLNTEVDELRLKPLPQIGHLSIELENALATHFVDLTKLSDPLEALNKLSELCLLTPLRKGPYGVEGLNAAMETIVKGRVAGLTNKRHYHGQPILITANSYSQGLFNGDLGIVMADDKDPSSLFACFPEESEHYKRYPLTALPAFESAYAFTVHKSQGSEYERVILVLPSIDSPIMSRELVYTAISRSRQAAEIWGHADSLTQAIQQPTRRTSGILDYLA